MADLSQITSRSELVRRVQDHPLHFANDVWDLIIRLREVEEALTEVQRSIAETRGVIVDAKGVKV